MRSLVIIVSMCFYTIASTGTQDFTSGMINERNVIQDYHTLDENCIVFFLYLGKYNRTRWGDSVYIKVSFNLRERFYSANFLAPEQKYYLGYDKQYFTTKGEVIRKRALHVNTIILHCNTPQPNMDEIFRLLDFGLTYPDEIVKRQHVCFINSGGWQAEFFRVAEYYKSEMAFSGVPGGYDYIWSVDNSLIDSILNIQKHRYYGDIKSSRYYNAWVRPKGMLDYYTENDSFYVYVRQESDEYLDGFLKKNDGTAFFDDTSNKSNHKVIGAFSEYISIHNSLNDYFVRVNDTMFYYYSAQKEILLGPYTLSKSDSICINARFSPTLIGSRIGDSILLEVGYYAELYSLYFNTKTMGIDGVRIPKNYYGKSILTEVIAECKKEKEEQYFKAVILPERYQIIAVLAAFVIILNVFLARGKF